MRSLTCSLVLPDGRKLAVRAAARWEEEVVKYAHIGESSLLRPFAKEGTLGFLEWYMTSMATNYHAELSHEWSGEYEPRVVNREPVVLVAEDDSNDFFLLHSAFRESGARHRIVRACDGEEAVEYVEGTGRFPNRVEYPFPELLLLDLKMPRMDGFEVLARIREIEVPQFPVVVLSGSALEEDRKRARELGAQEYIVKPVEFEGMLKITKALVNQWLVPK